MNSVVHTLDMLANDNEVRARPPSKITITRSAQDIVDVEIAWSERVTSRPASYYALVQPFQRADAGSGNGAGVGAAGETGVGAADGAGVGAGVGAADEAAVGVAGDGPDFPPYAPYPLISNREKDFRAALEQGAVGQDVAWVAMPKVHGVNTTVTVQCATREVRFGRRNGYLDLGREKFYDVEHVVGQYPWARLAALFPAARSVTVYGELYGGVFGTLPGEGAVQREVHYDPKRAFVAFDLAVDGHMATVYDMMHVMRKLRVPVPPIKFRGLALDVYAWARAHAEDPAVLMRPGLDVAALGGAPNTGEGWVVRPVVEAEHHGSRLLFKVKSKTFDETCKVPKVDSKKALRELAARTQPAIVVPRALVVSVLSKESETTMQTAPWPDLARLVLNQVLVDNPGLGSSPATIAAAQRASFQALGEVLDARTRARK